MEAELFPEKYLEEMTKETVEVSGPNGKYLMKDGEVKEFVDGKPKQRLIVGIPLKNDIESFNAAIISLYNSTRAFDKIVIILGECTDKSDELAYKKQKLDPSKIEVIDAKTKTPLEAYNLLFKIAKERKSDLLITQTDVLFPQLYKRDWLQIMKSYSIPETIGAVTTINGTGMAGPDYIDGFEWLGGWCTYFPIRTIDKIGGYDEHFPNGFGVDIDHTYRIVKAGLKIVKINYWVDHHMMNERQHDTDPNTEQMKQDSSKYFKKKWGII